MVLSSLWDATVPQLLAYGPYTDSTYALIVTWIEGRPLKRGDSRLLEGAAAALESIHRRGFLHGDVKLANFVVDDKSRVFCIDFGFAERCDDDEAYRREQRQLRACFGRT